LGSISTRIFRDFAQIFKDCAQIFMDFARIFNKSKLVGVRSHPRLLHHWFNETTIPIEACGSQRIEAKRKMAM